VPAALVAQAPVVDNVLGFVEVTSPNGKPETLAQHGDIKPGDVFHTQSGSQAVLHVGDNILRVNWDTTIEFQELTERRIHARLRRGSVAAEIQKLGEGEEWTFETPAGLTNLREVGIYKVDADPGIVWMRLTVQQGTGQIGRNGRFGLLHAGESGDLGVAGVIDVRQTLAREAFNSANWVWPVPGNRLHTLSTHEGNRQKADDIVDQANNPGAPQQILAPTHDLIVPSPIHTQPPYLGVPSIPRP